MSIERTKKVEKKNIDTDFDGCYCLPDVFLSDSDIGFGS